MSFERKDYTARDFDSIVDQTKSYITAKYPGVALDFSATSISIESIIMDICAYIADALNLYIDAGVSEGFVDSAAERDNQNSLAKLVGYPIGQRAASVADLLYTYTKLDVGAPNSITLPKGTTVKCSDGFKFAVTTADQTVSVAGSGTATFAVKQGVFVTDSYVATSAPGQRYSATRLKVASNVAITVTVDSVAWTQVATLIDQGAGQFYEVHWNGDGSFYVRFGDGTDGDIPANNVVLSYFITDGEDGNVSASTIKGSFNPHAQVLLTYTNEAASTGGADAESIESARRNIPAYASSQDRLVSYSDYKAVVETWPGVLYADIEFDSVLRKLICYVLSTSYGPLSDSTLAELDRYMRDRHQLLSSVIFRNVDFVNAYISLNVALESSQKYDQEDKKAEIQDIIERFFEAESGDPQYNRVGKDVYLSDFIRVVDEISGVNHVTVLTFTREPYLHKDTWSEASGTIFLNGWYLKPSIRIQQSANRAQRESALVTGAGPLQGVRVYPQQKVSRIFSSGQSPSSGQKIERLHGARWVAQDLLLKASVVPIESVKLQMSHLGGRYAWGSWYNTDDGELPIVLANRLIESTAQTAHFTVTHSLGGVDFPESSIGYIGRVFEIDSGSFEFMLDANTNSVASEALSFEDTGATYLEGTTSSKFIKAGTLTGVLTYSAHPAATYSDDGYGGLVDSRGVQVGYIDYDQGYLVFDTTRLVGTVSAITAQYEVFDFPNMVGEKAELLVSPYVGDIPVDRREFCTLSFLNLEVSYE